ncbi:MAG: hypothetical protein JXR76_03675 [Deltaproteobacteria bacterium]|nr:hypothetical protein [Deltaproteobacteria bacterium]
MNQLSSIHNTGVGKILLMVDRSEDAQTLVRRAFSGLFSDIYTAGRVTEADMILREMRPTHLVCEYDMGDSEDGIALTLKWRRMYPELSRVCICSSYHFGDLRLPNHLDGAYFKGDPLYHLLSALLPSETDTDTVKTRIGGHQ